MGILTMKASRDPATGQVYVPPRQLVADGSLRAAVPDEVAAEGTLYAATTFGDECYGIVDLGCGARVLALLEPGTGRIGERVVATGATADGRPRFGHA